VCLFIDEAQFCKGMFQGLFLTRVSPSTTDLFHALFTSASCLASQAHVVFCGTHPNMHRIVREVSAAQGGPSSFSLVTYITSDMMVESMARYLRLSASELEADEGVMDSLRKLEGRAANFFGDGWAKIQAKLSEASSVATPTITLVREALGAAVVELEGSFVDVVDGFCKGATEEVVHQVLDAVLSWRGATEIIQRLARRFRRVRACHRSPRRSRRRLFHRATDAPRADEAAGER
jgi:hypothetical protein